MKTNYGKVFSAIAGMAQNVIGMVEQMDATTRGNDVLSIAQVGDLVLVEIMDVGLAIGKLTFKNYDTTIQVGNNIGSWRFSVEIQHSTHPLTSAEKSAWSTQNTKVENVVALLRY